MAIYEQEVTLDASTPYAFQENKTGLGFELEGLELYQGLPQGIVSTTTAIERQTATEISKVSQILPDRKPTITTYNNPQTPEGPYLKFSQKTTMGLQDVKLGSESAFMGAGGSASFSGAITVESTEILFGTDQTFINYSINNATDVDFTLNGEVFCAKSSTIVSVGIENSQVTKIQEKLSVGPLVLTLSSANENPVLSFNIAKTTNDIQKGGIKLTNTMSVSIENLEMTGLPSGEAVDGYKASHNQSNAQTQTRIFQQQERAKASAKKKILNTFN